MEKENFPIFLYFPQNIIRTNELIWLVNTFHIFVIIFNCLWLDSILLFRNHKSLNLSASFLRKRFQILSRWWTKESPKDCLSIAGSVLHLLLSSTFADLFVSFLTISFGPSILLGNIFYIQQLLHSPRYLYFSSHRTREKRRRSYLYTLYNLVLWNQPVSQPRLHRIQLTLKMVLVPVFQGKHTCNHYLSRQEQRIWCPIWWVCPYCTAECLIGVLTLPVVHQLPLK